MLTVDSPAAGQNRISGTSDGVAFESLTSFDVANVTIDTATNDVGSPSDSVTIGASGLETTGIQNFTIATGAVAFSPGSNLDVEVNGTTPGVDYIQLDVTGTVALGGATLDVTLGGGFLAQAGERIVLIDNDGADAVTGTFAGLPEGAVLSVGGAVFTVTYEGGDGNDMVLVVPYVVTTTNDAGAGSLREAINATNANPGLDAINFNISGAGPHTIQPLSALPTITDPVIIDGYTQPGAAANTNPVGSGLNTVLMIELDGSNTPIYTKGLTIAAENSTVRGLVVNRFGFDDQGVAISSEGDGNVIEGNFIGTDITGTVPAGNQHGVAIHGSNNLIGGTTPESRNVISGNVQQGVLIAIGTTDNAVQGNFIGTDLAGTAQLGNLYYGVYVSGASNNTIGGTALGAGNVISGNKYGVNLAGSGSTGNLIQGNYIGTDVTGIVDLGNSSTGVFISEACNNTIGGTSVGAANTIAFNGGDNIGFFGGDGVFVQLGTGNAIRSNSIFSNAGLGIDLGANYRTLNDPADSDTGANNLQNFPVLTSALSGSGSTIVQGTLNSTPNTTFSIDLYANTAQDGSGYGEGETFLGSTVVTTDAGGNASFAQSFGSPVPVGHFITATATDPDNNTSEFSLATTVVPGFIVNTTDDADDGVCDATHTSLREAINAANANPGLDTVAFNISGSGPHSIQPTFALPTITDPVIIDGYTQPGAATNTSPVGSGLNTVLMVELDGTLAGSGSSGLYITGDNSTVRGLAVNRFFSHGIYIKGGSHNIVEGNFVGTDISGTLDMGNGFDGVLIYAPPESPVASDNRVGGTGGAANVISGNDRFGILVSRAGAARNQIQGNFIGADVTGTHALGNVGTGIFLVGPDNVIGGTAPGQGNLISANWNGIVISLALAERSAQKDR